MAPPFGTPGVTLGPSAACGVVRQRCAFSYDACRQQFRYRPTAGCIVGQFSISAHLYDYSASAEPRGSVSITTEHASLSAAAAAPSHGSLRSRLHVIKTFKTEQGNRRHQTPPPNHRGASLSTHHGVKSVLPPDESL